MGIRKDVARLLLGLLMLAWAAPVSVLLSAATGGLEAKAQSSVIRIIRVEGNRRVEPETVRSYLQFGVGDRYDPLKVDDSLKALFATGLFSDVRIRRQNTTVIVVVVENPIINRIAFEGNDEIDDDTLKGEVQLKPRAVFTRAKVQSDVQRILDVYRQQGRFAAGVEAKIIKLPHNRVDLVFEIQDGPKTTVRSINFVGNIAFSDSQLREIITTTKTGLLSFLKPTNVYDPDRLNLDRELLRQFYLKNGYADARIVSAVADLDRDGRGFFITFTIEEGEQYRFGAFDIETTLPSLDPEQARDKVAFRAGKVFNAEKVDQSVEAITIEVAALGYAFARVRPRADRDPIARTISLTFVIEQGPRVYIERIEIIGNTRTLDEVIRREFRLAEGDAYNRLLVDAARRRLRALGFFKSVKISNEPGSAADRVILVVNVVEQPTGELSFGAGYSSNEGVIGDISLAERNLLGKGQFVRLRFSGSLERFQVDFSFTEPRFMGRNMSAGFDLFHRETDLTDESSFKSRRTGGGLRLGVPLGGDWRITNRYTFVREEIFDVQDDASQVVQDAEGSTNVSSIGYTLVYDTRNHKRNPTQGIYFALTQDLAGIGGDVKYVRTVGDARGYYPIRKRITLVGRVQGGYIEGYGGEDVRLQDLFFKGPETIRGFERAGIGPRDTSTGDSLGGRVFAAATTEVRFPLPLLPENLGMTGAVFADVATLFETGDLGSIDQSLVVDDDTIRASVGFSLIWQSPVGPLRADFAHVLNSSAFDEEEVFRFGAATQF
ncbi:MAG: outer membrane protein assembly factor BamA [Hyphomicrobiales bacterium]|nr:outer membrane protein assembly factor BamA [Hyphomicrobiales bacterium]